MEHGSWEDASKSNRIFIVDEQQIFGTTNRLVGTSLSSKMTFIRIRSLSRPSQYSFLVILPANYVVHSVGASLQTV